MGHHGQLSAVSCMAIWGTIFSCHLQESRKRRCEGRARLCVDAHVLMQQSLQGQGDEHKAMRERWGEEHG